MMTNSAQIVLTGYVGTEPKTWTTNSNTPVCNFRVGSTRRYFSTKENQWKSAETTWVQVKSFRNLATHAMKSLSVGDPVIIVGALSIDSWEKDGVRHTIPTIEATSIGHNLSFGDGMFKKDESLKNTPQQTQSVPSVPSQNSSSQAAVSENESSAHDIVDAPVNI
ncbi:single-strand binding family protein [Alloscardovia omnicolens F0580]|uniref:Single-stranded DNA-binding protein n=1 Tax=Alloscardovia omnicolens F0580 TaxID=1321816 RepID=U1RAJ9_9BIFI|nr:single-stranded DNA-binding protein [Alloscardovia omnicolens]ERH31041.1 single-strand binding family protein [Alloscardovia omnicolens F0580]